MVFLVPDVANADKAAGRSRRYNIIFTPQKVLPVLLQNSFILHHADNSLLAPCLFQFYACDAVLEEQGLFEGKIFFMTFYYHWF